MTSDEMNRLERLEKKVDALAEQLAKQKGFFGGVVFAVSALWAFGLAAFEYMRNPH